MYFYSAVETINHPSTAMDDAERMDAWHRFVSTVRLVREVTGDLTTDESSAA